MKKVFIVKYNACYDNPEEARIETIVESKDHFLLWLDEHNASRDAAPESEEEFDLIARVKMQYGGMSSIPCTKCNYCMPCPNGLDIPQNIELYNQAIVHKGNALSQSKTLYNNFLAKEKRAVNCIGCRVCEAKCPQEIKISEWMPVVHEKLAKE